MTSFLIALLPIGLAATAVALVRLGLLQWLALRPLGVLLAAAAVGTVYRLLAGPTPDSELVRAMARFGLAALAFLAAQQCRLSRLPVLSPAAFRLSFYAGPAGVFLTAGVLSVLLPGIGLSALMVLAAALALGGAPALATPLLTAPIASPTRIAARLEGAAIVVLTVPLAALLEAGAAGSLTGGAFRLDQAPLFKAVAGFAVGGTMGLLAGRKLAVGDAPLPVLPFLVGLAAYATASALGIDAVLAASGAGLLYAEEAKLSASVRTRLFRTGETILLPFAMAGCGFYFGPLLFDADFGLWIAALLAVTVLRVLPRWAALSGTSLQGPDRQFLAWYGGAPGAASALFLLSLVASPAAMLDVRALTLGAAAVFAGVALTRLSSRLLTRRLVQETARARRPNYRPA